MTTATMIYNIDIYTGTTVIENGFVVFDNGKISTVGSMDNCTDDRFFSKKINGTNHFLIPGMIDVHIHGAAGADTMDGDISSLKTFAKAVVAEGTTAFLPTTITQTADTIMGALTNIANYTQQQTAQEAEIIGVHLEGPFVNVANAGAQPTQYIVDPDVKLFKKFQTAAGNLIKIVTIAPELPNGLAFVEYLNETGVIASIGHSGATSAETDRAFAAGVKHVTHLYNGLNPFHHRAAGVVGAALFNKKAFVEMIVDGHHVDPYVVKLTYQVKGSDQILLITDSMRAKSLEDGEYELGGQTVFVKDGQARLESGALAGSTLKMNEAVKNMLTFTDCTLADIVKMTSVNQAKQLGIFDRKGSISAGKDADLVMLNKNYEVVKTICKGQIAFDKEIISN